MFNKFTTADKLLFIAAFISLIFSEILYFNGEANAAIFIGLWVPSILAFGIYLKLINNRKNDWNNTLFRRPCDNIIRRWLFPRNKRNEQTKSWLIRLICYSINAFYLLNQTIWIVYSGFSIRENIQEVIPSLFIK